MYRLALSVNWKKVTELQWVLIISLVLALTLDLLVTAARFSLHYANITRLVAQSENKAPQYNPTLKLLNEPEFPRASLLVAQYMLHFFLVGAALFLFFPNGFGQGQVLSIILILLVIALLLPLFEWGFDRQVDHNPEVWAMRLTPLIRVLVVIFYPLAFMILGITRSMNSGEMNAAVTEDELKSMVDAGEQEGLLEEEEREMIFSIFSLGDTLAREIMVPRIDVVALDVQTPVDMAVDLLLKSGHSRVPVYEESVDHILGLLYSRDLLSVMREGTQVQLREILRPAYFIPEAKKVDELMAEMQSGRIHMAIVVDEYGGVAGVVTLEDIVEEIVGEIQDEYDQTEDLPYQRVKEGEYVFQGRIDLDDFNEIMSSSLPKDEADTLGGFIYNRIGRVPTSGESIKAGDLLLTVEQVTGRRIRKVKAQWAPKPQDVSEEIHDDNR